MWYQWLVSLTITVAAYLWSLIMLAITVADLYCNLYGARKIKLNVRICILNHNGPWLWHYLAALSHGPFAKMILMYIAWKVNGLGDVLNGTETIAPCKPSYRRHICPRILKQYYQPFKLKFFNEYHKVTHKVLIVIVGKEALQSAGPVGPTLQQAVLTLWPAHVAVPRVLFYSCLCRAGPHPQIHTFHTEAPVKKHKKTSP